MNKKQLEMKASGVFATYTGHYRDFAEGSIFLAKEGACTITLTGAASMSQEELDEYGRKLAQALNQNE
jgi:hypothetical protein